MEEALRFVDYNLKIKNNETWFHILKDLNFTISKGEITAIIGASGSGKSMTLNAILQLFEQLNAISQTGEIFIFQKPALTKDILKFEINELKALRCNDIGMTFQQSAQILNPSLTILQQLKERIRHKFNKKQEILEKCSEVLKTVGIQDVSVTLVKYPHQLSGGQLQRVLIALGIIHNPKILLIDEPTSSIDAALKVEILELIKSLNVSYGLTIVMVSHNLQLIGQYSDRVIVLNEGEVVENGPSENIFKTPKSPITKELLFNKSLKHKTDSSKSVEELMRLSDIGIAYDVKKEIFKKERISILSQFNLVIHKGETLGLVGNSGTGKSTIAKIMLGLEMPHSGEVLYDNNSIYSFNQKEYKLFRKSVQLIFQDPLSCLTPHRTSMQFTIFRMLGAAE